MIGADFFATDRRDCDERIALQEREIPIEAVDEPNDLEVETNHGRNRQTPASSSCRRLGFGLLRHDCDEQIWPSQLEVRRVTSAPCGDPKIALKIWRASPESRDFRYGQIVDTSGS